MIELPGPYLLFLGNAADELAAKTAKALFEWVPEKCIGQISFPDCQVDLDLPHLSIEQAKAKGAKSLVIGTTAPGGRCALAWHPIISHALRCGLNIVSGLHEQIAKIPSIAQEANESQKKIFDLRQATLPIPIGKGIKRSGKRLLTVGTDCSIGKMYTALSLSQALKQRGIKASFRATGQTGMMISGAGIAVDAVISDFIAGAAETLSPDNQTNHWDIIEGQGSIMHPSFSGVSLGLLHGSQPDAIVMCHEAGRAHMRGLSHYPMPSLQTCIRLTLELARITNPHVSCIGISINSSKLDESERTRTLEEIEQKTGLLTIDPKIDTSPLVERLLEL